MVCAEQRRHRLLAEDQGTSYEPNLETFLVGAIDASLFAQNLVIAFESQGLGTCYIGGLRNDLQAVSELLDVQKDVFPLYGLCVGEPLDPSETKPRLAVDSVLAVDEFPIEDRVLEQIAEYDERMGAYYAERDLAGRNWSGGVKRKFAKRTRGSPARLLRGPGSAAPLIRLAIRLRREQATTCGEEPGRFLAAQGGSRLRRGATSRRTREAQGPSRSPCDLGRPDSAGPGTSRCDSLSCSSALAIF